MRVPVIAFFNSRNGAGKTFLIYHLAWMYADLGYSVVAADFDPQADLSAALLGVDRFEELRSDERLHTLSDSLRALLAGREEMLDPCLERAQEGLESIVLPMDLQDMEPTVIVGDPNLASFEEELFEVWSRGRSGDEKAFRLMAAFRRIVERAAEIRNAQVVLVDLGSSLGAVNRAALVAADFVVFPIAADLISLQALLPMGSALKRWRRERSEGGEMQPIGYVVQRPPVRLDRPARGQERWLAKIPEVYRSAILGDPEEAGIGIEEDPHCLSLLKPYPGLLSLAHEECKPIFHLKPADGAMGSHNEAVKSVERALTHLAQTIAERTGLPKRSR